MKSAKLPATEAERIEALLETQILDTPPERSLDQLTALAAKLCKAPIALITLVDVDRQWFKSRHGLDVMETSRDVAFCAHAILQDDLFVVPDTLEDERFADNPLVTQEPKIRFYAGSPLMTDDGHAIGTFCVIDRVAHDLPPEHARALRTLSNHVSAILQLRRTKALLAKKSLEWEEAEQSGRGTQRAEALADLGEHFQRLVRERRLAEAELHRLEEQLQTIEVLENARSLEEVTQALREPLSVIRSGCNALRRRIEQDQPLLDQVDELSAAADRASAILSAVERRRDA